MSYFRAKLQIPIGEAGCESWVCSSLHFWLWAFPVFYFYCLKFSPSTHKVTVKCSHLILFLIVPLFYFSASASGSKEACSGKEKTNLNYLDYLKWNSFSVFQLASFTVKNEGKCINPMSWRTTIGLLGTATRKILVVALGKKRRKQWTVSAQNCPLSALVTLQW